MRLFILTALFVFGTCTSVFAQTQQQSSLFDSTIQFHPSFSSHHIKAMFSMQVSQGIKALDPAATTFNNAAIHADRNNLMSLKDNGISNFDIYEVYQNSAINNLEIDNYMLKYKGNNPALYEAGRNTIFSQIENPFSRNRQF
ncbi:MAG: hypothetical protein ACSHWW_12235 [Nonlabens sp.]|uniref:hypothetical protein n=1 Tax=Nonlabens sp. TaxID=1888209 RepID=UPI003EFA8E96